MRNIIPYLLFGFVLLVGGCADPCDDVVCQFGNCIDGVCPDPCENVNCNSGNCNEGFCDCDEGFEGNMCDTEVRAKYLGTWSGPNECDNDIVMLETITLEITESESNILDITLTITIDAMGQDVEVPSETTTLTGNAFETGPSITDLGGFQVEVSTDGIFRSDTELGLDILVNTELPVIGQITISCTADLVKQ